MDGYLTIGIHLKVTIDGYNFWTMCLNRGSFILAMIALGLIIWVKGMFIQFLDRKQNGFVGFICSIWFITSDSRGFDELLLRGFYYKHNLQSIFCPLSYLIIHIEGHSRRKFIPSKNKSTRSVAE